MIPFVSFRKASSLLSHVLALLSYFRATPMHRTPGWPCTAADGMPRCLSPTRLLAHDIDARYRVTYVALPHTHKIKILFRGGRFIEKYTHTEPRPSNVVM